MSPARDPRPLVVHVVYRFDIGGLENGLVNLINNLPVACYRHAVVALTGITDFRFRIDRPDVEFVALNKAPGHGITLYPRLYRLFRRMQPSIVHTRNLAALEASVPAWAAGVPVRIHGEHGRDAGDFDGSNRKYRWVRRLYRPFVTRYVAVSRDLGVYLTESVGFSEDRVEQIYNGVDGKRFAPAEGATAAIDGYPFADPRLFVVGTVGRMVEVKDQLTLAHAFVHALRGQPHLQERLRLVLVGEGPLRAEALRILEGAGLAHAAWAPGARSDIPAILRGLDCFVLPSRGEGMSNTILEAMATGLPVIATKVGGNAELVEDGRTGRLVAAGDVAGLAAAIVSYASDVDAARAEGREGRRKVERLFTLEAMAKRYQQLYDRALGSSPTRVQHMDPA